MKHSLMLRRTDLRLLSKLIQSAIDGDECIEDDDHLERVEYVLKLVNRELIVLGDFD
jgi:hypothetical protein